ncbi:MAG TPA: hypothetical protein VGU71_22435 [Candidatus Dormibacteraeota bacterium]|nr:hypothetical protein [Candidatus Dormibacteraeota bacterium]
MPNRFTEDKLLQAIGAVVNLASYSIKKVSTGDDLKVRTVTIILETASSGWVQDVLQFDREPHVGEPEPEAGLLVTADQDGHVEAVSRDQGLMDLPKVAEPADLTEKDETLAAQEPTEDGPQLNDEAVNRVVAAGDRLRGKR